MSVILCPMHIVLKELWNRSPRCTSVNLLRVAHEALETCEESSRNLEVWNQLITWCKPVRWQWHYRFSSAFVCCSFRSASLDSKMNLPTLQVHHILLLFELWTLQKVGIRLWHGVKCTFQLEVRLHPAWAIFLLTGIPQFAHTWMEKQAEFGLHDLIPIRKYGNG